MLDENALCFVSRAARRLPHSGAAALRRGGLPPGGPWPLVAMIWINHCSYRDSPYRQLVAATRCKVPTFPGNALFFAAFVTSHFRTKNRCLGTSAHFSWKCFSHPALMVYLRVSGSGAFQN